MVISDPKLSKLLVYFSSINKDAYQNEFLLANDVLAKTPPIVNMLEVYFFGRERKKATFSFVIKKLLFFYKKREYMSPNGDKMVNFEKKWCVGLR